MHQGRFRGAVLPRVQRSVHDLPVEGNRTPRRSPHHGRTRHRPASRSFRTASACARFTIAPSIKTWSESHRTTRCGSRSGCSRRTTDRCSNSSRPSMTAEPSPVAKASQPEPESRHASRRRGSTSCPGVELRSLSRTRRLDAPLRALPRDFAASRATQRESRPLAGILSPTARRCRAGSAPPLRASSSPSTSTSGPPIMKSVWARRAVDAHRLELLVAGQLVEGAAPPGQAVP